MNRSIIVLATLVAIIAAGVGGYLAAKRDLLPDPVALQTRMKRAPDFVEKGAMPPTDRPILYYQSPDGTDYSPVPKKTADGRDYQPVMADADERAATVSAPSAAERKIKFYRNPMGLPDTSVAPKKDSMGMDYIPVYDGDDSDDGSVKVSAGKIQRTGVRSEPASLRVIDALIRAPGTVQLDERRIAVISMRSEAFVQKVEDVTTGSAVRKGQPLLRLYMPAAAAAAASYVATMPAGNAASGTNTQGSRQRLMNLDLPESVIATIEKTRETPISIAWPAPRDGIIVERNVVDGVRVQPGDVLFRLADVSVVWAIVEIAERDLANVVVGQQASIRARSRAGQVFAGKVGIIYPQINRETRTARVRIELANPDAVLLPDMYVDAEINTGTPQSVLSIPESAVLDTGSRQAVFVDKGEGRLEPRDVTLGARGGGYVEVRNGLMEGDAIVVAANFLVDAESNLKAALKGFAETGAAQ